MKQKGRPLGETLKEDTQKPLGHPLILGACLHVEHPCLKPLAKKKR